MIPVKSELFPMVFQKPNACSSIFAGVSYNSLVRLVEINKLDVRWTSSPWWCDHVNTSSVELSDVLADLWHQEELYGFYYRPVKSLCKTPPQVVQTIAISHELRLAPQNQLHRCVPFVDAVTWICFVLWFSMYSWFCCPKVECYALPATSLYVLTYVVIFKTWKCFSLG